MNKSGPLSVKVWLLHRVPGFVLLSAGAHVTETGGELQLHAAVGAIKCQPE